MIGEIMVTVKRVTTTTDAYGNESTAETSEAVAGVLFEPPQTVERTDSRTPGVVSPAKFYFKTAVSLNADDAIVDPAGVRWQVQGGSMVWRDRTEVPVIRGVEV